MYFSLLPLSLEDLGPHARPSDHMRLHEHHVCWKPSLVTNLRCFKMKICRSFGLLKHRSRAVPIQSTLEAIDNNGSGLALSHRVRLYLTAYHSTAQQDAIVSFIITRFYPEWLTAHPTCYLFYLSWWHFYKCCSLVLYTSTNSGKNCERNIHLTHTTRGAKSSY